MELPECPPPTIGGSGLFGVYGITPGLVLLYQVHDEAGKATGYCVGAKFYSPTNGFKRNASECRVYGGNPTIATPTSVTGTTQAAITPAPG
jgi:hypothetical protein